MPHITTCTNCGKAYEESSEETANDPARKCSACLNTKNAATRPAEASAESSIMPAHNQSGTGSPEQVQEAGEGVAGSRRDGGKRRQLSMGARPRIVTVDQTHIDHLDDMLQDYKAMVEEYREGILNKEGIVPDEKDLELLIKYDAIAGNAERALEALKSS